MKRKLFFLTVLCLSIFSIHSGQACTDFRLIAKDGTVLITRSMEFSQPLNSNLRTSTRGRNFVTTAPDGKPAMNWKAKYGYVYLDGMNQNFAVDGMNEQGLSFEYLLFPGEAGYQTVPAGKESQALPYYYLGDWILGNFSTIAEVKQALMNTYVFESTLPGLNVVFPLHAAIFDASGKGIVVEIVNGHMSIYDNIGVMTNSPTYPWQVTNLRNYVNLSPYVPKPIVVNGITYAATGQGSGMVGLPGDISPPSRFVKIAILAASAFPTSGISDQLNLAQHIINNVDIPLGEVRSKDSNGKDIAELTEWVVFKDLTHKVIYYRTYNDMTLRYVPLAKINFAENAPSLKMPLVEAPYLLDVTNKFLNAKTN